MIESDALLILVLSFAAAAARLGVELLGRVRK